MQALSANKDTDPIPQEGHRSNKINTTTKTIRAQPAKRGGQIREYEALHPEQTLKRADKAPIQTQRTGIIRNIPTRAEIKEKKRVCRSNLRETLNIVLNWTEEKRAILGYYPIAKEQLTKLVIFPDASPSDTYQFFQEMRLLVEFESAFYNLSGLLEKLPEGIKRNLCYLIKDREDHKCQLCVSELSEESNNKTESTHMIEEEDNASEGHIMKEEDSTSEASLNIIA
ncbi:uncharacterized protein DS421_12g383990 [Arachis hypogaea]|nr:uncharacterized protein DS421_12g383990 [Arachis hypogaea]